VVFIISFVASSKANEKSVEITVVSLVPAAAA
jgi:hypothetical protein